MQKWLINNLWLKVISLILAVIAWLYISGEVTETPASYYPRPPIISKP